MREYDIYIKKRLTEGRLIVQSIPYRDGVSATNHILLETMLAYYTLQKFVAASTESAFVTEIDELLATVHEIVGNSVEIKIDADFFATVKAELEENGIGIETSEAVAFERSFFDVQNTMQFQLSDAVSGIKVALGTGENKLGIEVAYRDDLKTDFEKVNEAVGIETSEADSAKHDFEAIDHAIVLDSGALDLFYRYSTAVTAAFAIAIDLADIEIHWSLGGGSNKIEIVTTEDGNFATKFITVDQAMTIVSELSATLNQLFSVDGSIVMQTDASAGLKLYRLLEDIDPYDLADIDDLSLDELDYEELA